MTLENAIVTTAVVSQPLCHNPNIYNGVRYILVYFNLNIFPTKKNLLSELC